MSNEVTKTNGGALTQHGAGNPFIAYGEASRQTAIVGQLLKFSKGDWLVGQHNDPVAEGTTFVANMDEMLVGWIRWSENKPTDHVMGKVSSGFQPPRRNELGDPDPDTWEMDENGNARDPWQKSNYLLLMDGGGDLFTFTTSSTGGRNALGDLCIRYGNAMRTKPNDWPIVKIGSGSYAHSNKAFGRIKYPVFEIVGWAPKAEFTSPIEGDDRAEEVVDNPLPEAVPAKATAAVAAVVQPAKPKAKARF